MKPKFEEKSYEAAFNAELTRRTNIFFAPGQCAEGRLGFDFALFLDDPFLWDYMPYIRPRRARRRSLGISIREIEDGLGRAFSHSEENIKQNLFIQYKRCEYLKTQKAGEWDHWKTPYFRYEITPHQHKLLRKIADIASSRASVVYAAPAFWELEALARFTLNAQIIQESNIIDAVSFSAKHHHVTFSSAETHAIAHSEPEKIEPLGFDTLLTRAEDSEILPFARNLKELGSQLDGLGQDFFSENEVWLFTKESAFRDLLWYPSEERESFKEYPLVNALVSLSAFYRLTGCRIAFFAG